MILPRFDTAETAGNLEAVRAVDGFHCKVCGAPDLQELPEFSALPRVTSDCLPFREGGRLAVCAACGAAQALPDEKWYAEIDEIYSKYDVYHQSGGIEQHVFDRLGGGMRRRSDVLFERIEELADAPRSGRLLDVGCGNGVTLRAFSKREKWRLYGLDIHDRNQALLSALPGFDTLYTCPPRDVPNCFDLITLIHALEHFPDPCAFLMELRSKLGRNGMLFIQVPNAEANPFDYVVADHLAHFSPYDLAILLRRAGFGKIEIFTDWIMKEISLVARGKSSDQALEESHTSHSSLARVAPQVNWLRSVIENAKHAAATNASFGLFGSSIAATWLWSAVSDRVQFFVEEDPSRIGRRHLGCPILSPEQAPSESVVFMALAAPLAASIKLRLQHLPFRLCTPEPL
jgi:cyclopropane fatty-acyl-phospholipid synthase-like methyltransferase